MSEILELESAEPSLTRLRVLAWWELTKPRIAGMVLVATAVGFYLALPSFAGLDAGLLLTATLLGTGLVGAGANALNQVIEAPYDANMARTAGRPVPAQRISGAEAMSFALTLSVSGVLVLSLLVNVLAAIVALIALISYVFLYTPLKRVTPLCVFVGAIPGALPPVIGWAAASGSLDWGAWMLFLILFFWQLPHFAAIAWLYREDYARAGYPMLPVVDRSGTRTMMHVITHSVTLLTVSLLPTLYGGFGVAYTAGAMILGVAFLAFGVVFVASRSKGAARMHVLASVTYLPMLLILLVVDRASTF